jgi:hypothetical protein
MTYAFDEQIHSLNMKIANTRSELQQYQMIVLCNMIVDTIKMTKTMTEMEKEQYETIDILESKYPKIYEKVNEEINNRRI